MGHVMTNKYIFNYSLSAGIMMPEQAFFWPGCDWNMFKTDAKPKKSFLACLLSLDRHCRLRCCHAKTLM